MWSTPGGRSSRSGAGSRYFAAGSGRSWTTLAAALIAAPPLRHAPARRRRSTSRPSSTLRSSPRSFSSFAMVRATRFAPAYGRRSRVPPRSLRRARRSPVPLAPLGRRASGTGGPVLLQRLPAASTQPRDPGLGIVVARQEVADRRLQLRPGHGAPVDRDSGLAGGRAAPGMRSGARSAGAAGMFRTTPSGPRSLRRSAHRTQELRRRARAPASKSSESPPGWSFRTPSGAPAGSYLGTGTGQSLRAAWCLSFGGSRAFPSLQILSCPPRGVRTDQRARRTPRQRCRRLAHDCAQGTVEVGARARRSAALRSSRVGASCAACCSTRRARPPHRDGARRVRVYGPTSVVGLAGSSGSPGSVGLAAPAAPQRPRERSPAPQVLGSGLVAWRCLRVAGAP